MFNAQYIITKNSNGNFNVELTVSGFANGMSISDFYSFKHEYASVEEASHWQSLETSLNGAMLEIACSYARGETTLEEYGNVTKFILGQDHRKHPIVMG